MEAVGEFFDNLFETLWKSLYDGIYSVASEQFDGVFEALNANIKDAASYITKSPQNWNASAFSFIQSVAENACIPIAGIIMTLMFAMEAIHMTQEINQMQSIKSDRFTFLFVKLMIFLILCSKSFEIVMGVFEIGAWAATKANPNISTDLDVSLNKLLIPPKKYDFGAVMGMLINLILIFLARLVVHALAAGIFIKVNLWYMELLLYSSAAPIPMATFMNREWGQTGYNYVRKIIAVCFEGFFMLVAFGLYGALVTNLKIEGGDFMPNLFMTIGCGIALFFILCKSGSISSSVFNAH